MDSDAVRKIALIVLLSAAPCFAEGPVFQHPDTVTQQEFENVYKDIRKDITSFDVDYGTATNLWTQSIVMPSRGGPFPFTMHTATVTYDEITYFQMEGWNLLPGTVDQRYDTTKHQLNWERAYEFFDGAVSLCEWNLNYRSPGGTTYRPMKFDVNIETSTMTWWFGGNYIDFVLRNDTDRYARFTTTGSYVNGTFQVGGDTGPKFENGATSLSLLSASDSSKYDFTAGTITAWGHFVFDADSNKNLGSIDKRAVSVFTRAVDGGANGLSIKTRDNNDIVLYGGPSGATEIMRAGSDGVVNVTSTTRTGLLLLGGSVGWSTLTNNDTTPDVSTSNLWYANNSGATTITQFDGGTAGQIIVVLCRNANTTLSNANFFLAGGVNFVCTSDDVITLAQYGAGWIEMSRSIN